MTRRLSQGAKECLAHLRAYPASVSDGLRHCGRAALAKRTQRTERMVSHYIGELTAHGLLAVTPPRRRYTPGLGWRSIGVNGYRLCGDTAQPRPAMPRAKGHNRRSPRGEMNCTPSLILRDRGGPTRPTPRSSPDQNWQNTPAPDPETILTGVSQARAMLRRGKATTSIE